MGMYTEFSIDVRLRADTPANLIDVLEHLVVKRMELFKKESYAALHHTIPFPEEAARCIEAQAFLSDTRMVWLGNPGDGECISKNGRGEFLLVISADLKNYTSTLEKFWAWISPWIANEPGSVVGECRYEEFNHPSNVVVGQALEFGTGFDW